jgi:hypothetical protein
MADDSIIELDMNLADVQDFEILPDSKYPGVCTAAELRTSDKGNQYYYTNWKIEPENYPADYDVENNPEGTTLNYSRIQAPTSGSRREISAVKKHYAAMGLSLKTSKIDPSEWVGQKALLVVGHETYNGEARNSIVAVESLDA